MTEQPMEPMRKEGGWVSFGTHVDEAYCSFKGRMEFDEEGEDGLPNFERHADGSPCPEERGLFARLRDDVRSKLEGPEPTQSP